MISSVKRVVAAALNTPPEVVEKWTQDTKLLGALPEFDSMTVVAVITALENHFGIVFDDDDLTAEAFLSIGSIAALVNRKHQLQQPARVVHRQ